MRARYAVLVGLACIGVLATSAAAQPLFDAGQVTQTGEVELRILTPGGQPAANAEVLIGSTDRSSQGLGWQPRSVKSDKDGKVAVSWPIGIRTFRVSVKGIGYGLTGLTQVLPGKRAEAFLPPLAPWAIIRGQLPPDLRTPDVQLKVDAVASSDAILVAPKADGAFQAEVPAGDWWIKVSDKGRQTAQSPGTIAVFPGQTVTVSALEKSSPDSLFGPGGLALPSAPAERLPGATWVRGVVRDVAGKPVAARRSTPARPTTAAPAWVKWSVPPRPTRTAATPSSGKAA